MIGHFSLRLNTEQTTIEVGYVINRHFNGTGYESESFETLLTFIKTISQIEKVAAGADHQNIASHKVLQKNGFIHTKTNENVESLRGTPSTKYIFENIIRQES